MKITTQCMFVNTGECDLKPQVKIYPKEGEDKISDGCCFFHLYTKYMRKIFAKRRLKKRQKKICAL